MSRRLVLSLLILAAFPAVAAAAPTLIEEFHLTLPDSIYPDASIQFTDVNRDGRVDILANGPDRFASIDILTGEPLDYFYPIDRRGGTANGVGHLNSDNALDLAVVKLLPDHDDSLGLILWLSESTGFDVDTIVIPLPKNDSTKYALGPTIIDRNGDGIDEVYSGYYWAFCFYEHHYTACYEGTKSFLYDPASGVLATNIQVPSRFTNSYTYQSSRIDLAIEINTSLLSFYYADISSTKTRITVYRELSASFSEMISCPFDYDHNVPDYITEEAVCWATYLSNVVGDPDQPELIVAQANSIYSSYGYVEPQSNHELRCFTISEDDSLVEIWNVPWTYIYGIFAVQDRPDVFYTLESLDSVIERNALTGERLSAGKFSGTRSEYYAGLIQHEGDELVAFHKNADVRFYSVGIATAVDDSENRNLLPQSFVLSDPYPNPFNAEVNIPITVVTPGLIRVELYNTVGQRIKSLYDGTAACGDMRLTWDASKFSSGVYFIRAEMGEAKTSARVLLLK